MMGPPGQDGEDGEPGWPIPGPAGAGGGHAIEDEGVPVTVRANLDIIGENAQAVDDGTDTELRIGGRLYDAIVNTAANEGGVTPNTYATLALAIASGAASIFVYSNINAEADVTIGAGDAVLRISGRGPGCSYMPTATCNKNGVVFDNLSFINETLTFAGTFDVALSCLFQGTGCVAVASGGVGATLIRCAFIGCTASKCISITGGTSGGYYVDVTACVFNLCTPDYCIWMDSYYNAVVGCKFVGNVINAGGYCIYATANSCFCQINGCLAQGNTGSGMIVYIALTGFSVAGNIIFGTTTTAMSIGGNNVIAGNVFRSGNPCISFSNGYNIIANNLFYFAAGANNLVSCTLQYTLVKPNLFSGNYWFLTGGGTGCICIDLSYNANCAYQTICNNTFYSQSALLTEVNSLGNGTLCYSNTHLAVVLIADRGIQMVRAYNNTAGSLAAGTLVIWDATADEYVTTSTTVAQRPQVRGIVVITGSPLTWPTARWMPIAIDGVYPILCDENAVAIGDWLCMSVTTAGCAVAVAAPNRGEVIGMALQAKAAGAGGSSGLVLAQIGKF